MFIHLEFHGWLLFGLWNGNWNDFIIEVAGVYCFSGENLAPEGEFIGFLTRDIYMICRFSAVIPLPMHFSETGESSGIIGIGGISW